MSLGRISCRQVVRVLLLVLCAVWLGWQPWPTAADGDGWTYHELSPSAFGRALVLDADGQPHVAHCGLHSVHYASRDASGWHDETIVEQTGGDVDSAAIGLDRYGQPHVAFSDHFPGGNGLDPVIQIVPWGSVFWAAHDAWSWMPQTVQSGESTRYEVSAIAVADDGTRHVVVVATEGAFGSTVWYGRQPNTGPWELMRVIEVVPGGSRVGAADLVLDQSDCPVISLRGNGVSGHGVVVLRWEGVWQELWHMEGDLAVCTSLAVAPDGALHLLYTDMGHSSYATTVKHVWQTPAGWTSEIVRQGAFSSDLAIDADGLPHAVWIEGNIIQGYGTLNYARRSAGCWQAERVASNASVPHLALDRLDSPQVVYDVGGELRHAQRQALETAPVILWLSLVRR